jgi:UDP-N-acetylmuramate--alanine ligase
MYRKKAHLHFVGIGGIGMSGIATILKYQGYRISGCDIDVEQKSIQELRSIGCIIHEGHNTEYCNDSSIDVLVYSSAVKASSPEIIAAQDRGTPTIPRALMLAELMRTKYSVAIAGSHGKTTTTSMISHILIEAHTDPTVIIGGHLKNISTHARLGSGDFLVAESDESDRSFLYLHATLAIVTNIDLEHLETYRDLDDVKDTFKQFLSNLPFYGKAIVCVDDPNVRSILPLPHIKTIKYGLDDQAEYADIFASHIQLYADYSSFIVNHKTEKTVLGPVTVSMPGRHNILNALAAITLALELGITFEIAAAALQTFKGVDRRFSYKGLFNGAEIFDDYGHHPQEIFNTLQVARKRTKNKLTVIFQPHRYSRTHKLWDQFVDMFTSCPIDNLIITDIYPASEAPIPGVTAEKLVQAIQQKNPSFSVKYAPYDSSFDAIQQELNGCIADQDLILLQGAGKINKLADSLAKSNDQEAPL